MNRRLLALIICFLLLVIYFFNKEFISFFNRNGIAILKNKNRDVQTRRANSISWDDVSQGESFQYYDSILTMQESVAHIAFNDGTNLEMGPDSLVVLEPPLGVQAAMKLDLKRGSARIILKQGRGIELKTKLLTAHEDATVKITSDNKEDTILVENQKADAVSPVEIKTFIKRSREPAKSHDKLKAPTIKIKYEIFNIDALNTKPAITYLEQFVLLFFPKAEAEEVLGVPQLRWDGLHDAAFFEIEFAKDREFKNIIMSKTTKNTSTDWKLKTPGLFYWRVRGVDEEGNPGDFSEVASFVISLKTKEVVVDTPAVSSPIEPTPPKIKTIPKPVIVEASPLPYTPTSENIRKPTAVEEQSIHSNSFEFLPAFEFLDLKVQDNVTGAQANIYSNAVVGPDLKWNHSFSQSNTGFIKGGLRLYSLAQPTYLATLNNSNPATWDFDIGDQLRIFDSLNISLKLGYGELLSLSAINSSTLSVDVVRMPRLSLGGDLVLKQTKHFDILAKGEVSLLFQGQASAYTTRGGDNESLLLYGTETSPATNFSTAIGVRRSAFSTSFSSVQNLAVIVQFGVQFDFGPPKKSFSTGSDKP